MSSCKNLSTIFGMLFIPDNPKVVNVANYLLAEYRRGSVANIFIIFIGCIFI